jgi:hypothetical protein
MGQKTFYERMAGHVISHTMIINYENGIQSSYFCLSGHTKPLWNILKYQSCKKKCTKLMALPTY